MSLMKLKNALAEISPDDRQKEKMFCAVEKKLAAESDGKDAKMKKSKIAAIAAACVGAFLAVSGTAYAVSPEAREIIDDILGINRKSVDEYYEVYGNDSTDVDLLGTALQITEEDGQKPFAEGISSKITSVLNYGTGVELTVEFTFDEPIAGQIYNCVNITIEGGEGLSGWSWSPMDVREDGKAFMRINMDKFEEDPTEQQLTVTLTDIVPMGDTGLDYDRIINGEYTAEFTVGEAIQTKTIELEPAHISWTTEEMFGAVAEMEISRITISPKTVGIGIRMLEDCVVEGKNDTCASSYTNGACMFITGEGLAYMWLPEEDKPLCDSIPLKFKMSDGSIVDAKYTNATVTEPAYSNKQEQVTMDFTTDKVNDVYFEFPGIMDYSGVEAVIFCGYEIPIS